MYREEIEWWMAKEFPFFKVWIYCGAPESMKRDVSTPVDGLDKATKYSLLEYLSRIGVAERIMEKRTSYYRNLVKRFASVNPSLEDVVNYRYVKLLCDKVCRKS